MPAFFSSLSCASGLLFSPIFSAISFSAPLVYRTFTYASLWNPYLQPKFSLSLWFPREVQQHLKQKIGLPFVNMH